MNRFAELLDRLAYEPGRNNKLRLMTDYFRSQPDPERGYALAAITGALSFTNAKPGLIRTLITERTDPALFALSYDYVGDLSETVALMWPSRSEPCPLVSPYFGTSGAASTPAQGSPSLSEVIERLHTTGKVDLPAQLAHWLDLLDETGRWALLKLITGSLRVGVSARLAKTAVANLGGLDPNAIEEIWHGLKPPYIDLFAWVEGREPRPDISRLAPFRTPMLAHALELRDFDSLSPADFAAEWKWDGIRVQVATGIASTGRRVTRLYSRTGEEISNAFPDLIAAIEAPDFDAIAIDGELLVVRNGHVQSFAVLQQRLNRKTVSQRLLDDYPAHIRAYDLLTERGEDLRAMPYSQRRERLETFIERAASPRVDLSSHVTFTSWEDLARARADPASSGAGADAEAIEGVMLKRLDSVYMPGRPKGLWYKWKRDPFNIDAVLMYAQRGHGKRSSFYSDYTFGVWRAGPDGDELVPVGKAYFGFTDEELLQLDRYVRNHTTDRFGPVREIAASKDQGLVLEIAFEGLNRSSRHKSGVAMRFPRILRIRWDKPAQDADRIETLERLLPSP